MPHNDVLDIVFEHCDVPSKLRLSRAVRSVWKKIRYDVFFWLYAETLLPNQYRYIAFRAIHQHMGIKRRCITWSHYCDMDCSGCGLDLFGVCTGTFGLRKKFCLVCQRQYLVAETELQSWVPQWSLYRVREVLTYCWLPNRYNYNVRHYMRHQVDRFVRTNMLNTPNIVYSYMWPDMVSGA